MILPLIMAGASLLLPLADTPRRAALLFGLAGLGCSAFYPLTVALASRRFPGHVAWVSAMAYAALVTGIGAGSFFTGMLRVRLSFVTIYRWSALCPLLALLLAVPALATRARPAAARE
jgi:predicted MFS family arabinose efflux permease